MRKLLGVVALGVITAACGRIAEPLGPEGSGGSSGGMGGHVPVGGNGGNLPPGTGGEWAHGSGGAPGDCYPGGHEPIGVNLDTTRCPGFATYGNYGGYWCTIDDSKDDGGSTLCPRCNDVACTPAIGSRCATGIARKISEADLPFDFCITSLAID